MAERLNVIFIDVGWGDSILIEAEDAQGQISFGLIDSNDTLHQPTSLLFLKRYFERKGVHVPPDIQRVFRFMLLTHAHADHASGISRLIRKFGADYFLYSASSSPSDPALAQILRCAVTSSKRLGATMPLSAGTPLGSIPFGPVKLDVLWPDPGIGTSANENDNSVVMAMTLGEVSFIFTGDATSVVWPSVIGRLPKTTRVFQIPHHGAKNGTFDSSGGTPWLSSLPGRSNIEFAMSCHPVPHGHPHPSVEAALPVGRLRRTDTDYRIGFETDGTTVRSFYTR